MEKSKTRKKTVSTIISRNNYSEKSNKLIALEDFERMESSNVKFKLEWNNGKIERENRMKHEERIILINISRCFAKTELYKNGNEIMTEANVNLGKTNTVRVPDGCYLTRDEIVHSKNHLTTPQLVIEVASDANTSTHIQQKISEYFENGNCTIWYIYPEVRLVQVYTTLKTVKICTETDICEAILDGVLFEISVNDIFKDYKA